MFHFPVLNTELFVGIAYYITRKRCSSSCVIFHLTGISRLAISYKDLRSIPDFEERTILAIKAPQDTELNCDTEVDMPGPPQPCILISR